MKRLAVFRTTRNPTSRWLAGLVLLAWLVGMLTLGTALPHGVRFLDTGWGWQATVLVSSGLAVLAGTALAARGVASRTSRLSARTGG